jgi:hypothetical protein
VASPAVECLVEINIEHDAAEIEQQGVGGGGRELELDRRRRLRKLEPPGDGRAASCSMQDDHKRATVWQIPLRLTEEKARLAWVDVTPKLTSGGLAGSRASYR